MFFYNTYLYYRIRKTYKDAYEHRYARGGYMHSCVNFKRKYSEYGISRTEDAPSHMAAFYITT
jgi:hypothetical protein